LRFLAVIIAAGIVIGLFFAQLLLKFKLWYLFCNGLNKNFLLIDIVIWAVSGIVVLFVVAARIDAEKKRKNVK